MFTSREQLDESEAWYCPQCKKHQCAYKKLDVWKLPKILIVHLKRFQYSRYNREKIDTEITIPVRHFSPNDRLANQKHEPIAYDLIAISQHMGGLGSGHYTAKALLKT
jgi:ubiquitin carboxyl-terminal hydrolase 4/11/15